MNAMAKANLWGALAILVAVGALALILLDRYAYFDYEPARCDAAPAGFTATLVGSFSSETGKRRASPYYLAIRNEEAANSNVSLDSVVMRSAALPQGVDLRAMKKIDVPPSADAGRRIVFLVDGLELDYVTYSLSGVVVREREGNVSRVSFQCTLDKKFRTEWRISLLDRLMSV